MVLSFYVLQGHSNVNLLFSYVRGSIRFDPLMRIRNNKK